MEKLTDRQRQVASFIERNLQERGVSPTLREIARYFKFSSTRAAQDHIEALRRKGVLEDFESAHRSFLPKNWRPGQSIPLLGQVRAGLPVLAEENIDSYISVDRDMGRGGRLFALRVAGDSMIDAGIHEGDKVIIRQQEAAQNGDIVVALKEGEATVKYFRHRRGEPYLEPANPRYEPMPIQEFSIIGKVVGLIRSYTN